MKKSYIAVIVLGLLAFAGLSVFGGAEGAISSVAVAMATGGLLLGEVKEAQPPETKTLEKGLEAVKTLFTEFKQSQDERLKKLEKGEAIPAALEEKMTKLEEALTAADEKYQKLVDDKAALEAKVNAMNQIPVEEQKKKLHDEHKELFLHFCRKGDDNVSLSADQVKGLDLKEAERIYMADALVKMQMKTMSAGSDPDGGYMIPDPIARRMVELQTETSPIRQESTVENITIDEYTFLIDDEEVGAGWVDEHGGRPETDTSKLSRGRIVAHEIYANPFATQKMLDDAAMNVEQWLNRKVGNKFNLVENTAFVLGSGVGQPRGFMNYDNGTSWNQVQQINQGHATLLDDADGLINTQNALESWYGANAKWYMRRSTVGAVRLLKDTTGQYIWQPGLQAGEPNVLLGDPVIKCADIAAIGANALAVAYGDMRQAYTIVDRIGIRVLRDPYSNKPYVEFYTTKRVGGGLVNGCALKILKIAA